MTVCVAAGKHGETIGKNRGKYNAGGGRNQKKGGNTSSGRIRPERGGWEQGKAEEKEGVFHPRVLEKAGDSTIFNVYYSILQYLM